MKTRVRSMFTGSDMARSSKVESFKISPRSVMNFDPLTDGYESESLATMDARKSQKNGNGKGNKKPANPVVVEGYGKRNLFPKSKKKDEVPNSNRVVPGMPNAIKSQGADHINGMIITDTDIRFDSAATDPNSGYTTAQQIVKAGRPVTWSMSTSSQIQSLRASVSASVTNEFEAQAKYDPNDRSGYETSRRRVNNIIEGVSQAVDNIKAPTEAKHFDRNAEETRNLAFSAVPFLPWEASKILPIDKFDANNPYVPTKLNFNSPVAKESIVDDHAVLQNPALTKKFKNFNRTACGFGNW